ncbi:phasin family protein [Alcaligenaceae bacterium]|nr:phasin family protein [Alcaligenaceae bacterium]
MKNQIDNTGNVYQQQVASTQEICHILIESLSRIENIWLTQTSKALEQQAKLLHAITETQDPQGLSILPFSVLSRTPEDLISAQREMLEVVTQTQAKITEALGKHAEALKPSKQPKA